MRLEGAQSASKLEIRVPLNKGLDIPSFSTGGDPPGELSNCPASRSEDRSAWNVEFTKRATQNVSPKKIPGRGGPCWEIPSKNLPVEIFMKPLMSSPKKKLRKITSPAFNGTKAHPSLRWCFCKEFFLHRPTHLKSLQVTNQVIQAVTWLDPQTLEVT